jgi:hypothetical protein
MRFWKLPALATVSQVSGPSGKMQFGADAGCSAQVMPSSFVEDCVVDGEPDPLDAEQAASETAIAVVISAGPISRAFLVRPVLLMIFGTARPSLTETSLINLALL